MRSAFRHPIRIIAICVLVALSPLILSAPARDPSKPQRQISAQTTANTQAAPPNLSCTDYESIFGPNYYNQLFVSWDIWSRVKSITTTGATPLGNQTLVNYQYNTAAQQAYGLYATSMQNNGCSPAIDAPVPLDPAAPPDFTFDPSAQTPNLTCNTPLAYQYLASFVTQFYANQKQEQAQIEAWLRSSGSADGLTLATQQAALAIQTQFSVVTKALAQTYNTQIQAVGCP